MTVRSENYELFYLFSQRKVNWDTKNIESMKHSFDATTRWKLEFPSEVEYHIFFSLKNLNERWEGENAIEVEAVL